MILLMWYYLYSITYYTNNDTCEMHIFKEFNHPYIIASINKYMFTTKYIL